MITVRDQKLADFYKLGDMTSIFEFHKGLKIDIERVCAPEGFNATKSSLLFFNNKVFLKLIKEKNRKVQFNC